MGDLKDDYESEYEVVPDWVDEFFVDHIGGDIVISAGSGEWILMERYNGVGLDETQ